MTRREFVGRLIAIPGVMMVAGSSASRAEAEMATTETFEITKTDAEWRAILTPEQFRVLRRHGTERAGTSPLDKQYGRGTYVCAGCDLPLFKSDTKFDSGTGWPSFWAPIDRVLKVGDKAPDFVLPNAAEQPIDSRALLAGGPLVVTFYRGRW